MTQKTCGELFEGIDCTIIGNADELVSGIAYRSDCVKPGDAFCCIVGLKSDGHSYAQDAIDRGARVLIVERKIYLADATDITEVVVKDSRKAMARMASRVSSFIIVTHSAPWSLIQADMASLKGSKTHPPEADAARASAPALAACCQMSSRWLFTKRE